MAFPITSWLFTYRLTFWFWCLAMSDAMRLLAHRHAFRTIEHFASFIRAFNFTFRFLTFHVANCIFRFSTRSMAFWGFADWITNSWAMWIVTFPGTLRMALILNTLINKSYLCFHKCAGNCRNGQQSKNNNSLHFLCKINICLNMSIK
jgi:hypothetical protein